MPSIIKVKEFSLKIRGIFHWQDFSGAISQKGALEFVSLMIPFILCRMVKISLGTQSNSESIYYFSVTKVIIHVHPFCNQILLHRECCVICSNYIYPVLMPFYHRGVIFFMNLCIQITML